MKSGITIAEDSVDAGNKELEACLRSVNLDRNKLISAQSKISMGVKRKGELAYELGILKKKLEGYWTVKNNYIILYHLVYFNFLCKLLERLT